MSRPLEVTPGWVALPEPEPTPGYLVPDEVEEVAEDDAPANVDGRGVAHFLVIDPDGGERCGGCTSGWPCPDAVRLEVVPVEREPE